MTQPDGLPTRDDPIKKFALHMLSGAGMRHPCYGRRRRQRQLDRYYLLAALALLTTILYHIVRKQDHLMRGDVLARVVPITEVGLEE